MVRLDRVISNSQSDKHDRTDGQARSMNKYSTMVTEMGVQARNTITVSTLECDKAFMLA